MSEREFQAAIKRRGWHETGVFGYVSDGTLHVSRWNGGDNRRQQLVYLIKTFEKHAKKAVEES